MRPLHRRLLQCARSILADIEPEPDTAARVAKAEARLGRALPPGYRAFLQEVGRVTLPIWIGNVIDLAVEDAPWPAWFVPFADDNGGNLHGFDLRGKKGRELPIAYWDHEEPELDEKPGPPTKFEAWLEERIQDHERDALAAQPAAEAPTANRADAEEEDADIVLAQKLLHRLRERGQLETTRGFAADSVARALADVWSDPARILELLLDRGDVVEVFASEEDIAALQRDLAGPD